MIGSLIIATLLIGAYVRHIWMKLGLHLAMMQIDPLLLKIRHPFCVISIIQRRLHMLVPAITDNRGGCPVLSGASGAVRGLKVDT